MYTPVSMMLSVLAKKFPGMSLMWEAFATAIKLCTGAPTTKQDIVTVDAPEENKQPHH